MPFQYLKDDEEFLYRIGRLSLEPNDLVVVKSELILTKEQVEKIKGSMEIILRQAGFKNHVTVVTGGLTLMVLRKENDG